MHVINFSLLFVLFPFYHNFCIFCSCFTRVLKKLQTNGRTRIQRKNRNYVNFVVILSTYSGGLWANIYCNKYIVAVNAIAAVATDVIVVVVAALAAIVAACF